MLGAEPLHYRFGEGVSDLLLCGRCGVYVGAMSEIDGRHYVTLNLNAFDNPRSDLEAIPVSYEGEGREARIARRREHWTPARIETH